MILLYRTVSYINIIHMQDNVGFHRSVHVREMMEIRGFEWKLLPPYSPFLNPIECMFSQWKNHVKRSEPRNEPTLHQAINRVREVVLPTHLGPAFPALQTIEVLMIK